MIDSKGNISQPKTMEDALREVIFISSDKRGHVLLEDQCAWLELKIKAIRIMAKRGLKLRKVSTTKTTNSKNDKERK